MFLRRDILALSLFLVACRRRSETGASPDGGKRRRYAAAGSFTAEECAAIAAFADVLIPELEGFAGGDANVPQALSDADSAVAEWVKSGLAWLDRQTLRVSGSSFAALSDAQRAEWVARCADPSDEHGAASAGKARRLFLQLREATIR